MRHSTCGDHKHNRRVMLMKYKDTIIDKLSYMGAYFPYGYSTI